MDARFEDCCPVEAGGKTVAVRAARNASSSAAGGTVGWKLVCEAGMFTSAPGEAMACSPCPRGTFSAAGSDACAMCPRTRGVACTGGVLLPQGGYWSAARTRWGDVPANAWRETVFECLTPDSCVVNANASASRDPASAYACAEGHEGTLCAACGAGYFWRHARCERCDAAALNAAAKTTLWALVAGAALTVALKLCMRRRAGRMLAHLHVVRRSVRQRERRLRARRCRLRLRNRHGADYFDKTKRRKRKRTLQQQQQQQQQQREEEEEQ